MAQQIGRDVFTAKFRGEQTFLIDSSANRDVTTLKVRMRHMVEKAEREWIMQIAVFLELFRVIGPLKPVRHHVTAVVGAVEQIARFVEIEPPGVAAPFAEEFELVCQRVIPPHALLKVDPANVGRDVGPLRAVQPTVRAPSERIGERAGVFHSETREEHFGIAIGNVVVIAVGIEEEIRNIEDEDAAVTKGDARRQVQSRYEIL